MFAYCNNNPANCSDATGTVAKICLTADGRIEDSPWRNHSPGGGGFVYHCNDITTQYDGDKFYLQILLRYFANGAKKWWDAYVHSNELQVQQQYQQDMAIKSAITGELDSWSNDPKRAGDFVGLVATGTATYIEGAALAAGVTIPVVGQWILVGIGVAGFTWTALRHFNVI